MYIVIVGAGDLGYYLTHLLLEENHEVVVIDKDSKRCDKIANELDIVAINGDATDPSVLRKADINESDAGPGIRIQEGGGWRWYYNH